MFLRNTHARFVRHANPWPDMRRGGHFFYFCFSFRLVSRETTALARTHHTEIKRRVYDVHGLRYKWYNRTTTCIRTRIMDRYTYATVVRWQTIGLVAHCPPTYYRL